MACADHKIWPRPRQGPLRRSGNSTVRQVFFRSEQRETCGLVTVDQWPLIFQVPKLEVFLDIFDQILEVYPLIALFSAII